MTSTSIIRTKSHAATRSLVVYHFFEADWTYTKNLAHFLLFGYSRDADFLIVIAGECSIDLPKRPNIEYLRTKNQNNDFGGYCDALRHLGEKAFEYDFVHFVNCSVRGPFIAPLCSFDWRELYRQRLTGDIGLVGTTINILPISSPFGQLYHNMHGGDGPFSHVQTMAYAMPQAILRLLSEDGLFSIDTALHKYEVIRDYEVRMSQVILAKGWNIACLLPEYDGVDFRLPHAELNPRSSDGEPNFPHCYFGRTPHPYETLFTKTNRVLFSESYLDRLAFSLLCRSDSSSIWKDCSLISSYVAHLERAASSLENIHMSDVSTEDVLGLTESMLRQHPPTRTQVEALLARMPPG